MGTLDDLESVVGDFATRERPIGRIVLTASALDLTATLATFMPRPAIPFL
jgi:hypothetical protein